MTQPVRNLLDHAATPKFSPDGTKLVFAGKMPPSSKTDTFRDDEYEIFTINVDGTGLQRLTFDTYQDNYPDWSPDGSPIMFTRKRVSSWDSDVYRINPDGTGLALVSSGFTNAGRPTFRPTATDARAARFRPHLRYDSGETYSPLDVDLFFGERNDQGGPLHRICTTSSCSALYSKANLPQDAGSYIDFAGDGDADNYHSPYSACTQGDLRDCDGGPRSAIYYNTTPDGAGSYYVDYWFFYRYNDWPLTFGFDHEGDWEGVTIASSGNDPSTFHFASFSQHGGYFSYLRHNLSCDGGGPGSCGSATTPIGQRLDVFVSRGSHANYADECDPLISCDGTAWGGEEGPRDADRTWGNDNSDGALIPFPSVTDPGSWGAYPGHWGAPYDNGPSGPAFGSNGEHFWSPWSSQCYPDDCAGRPSSARARMSVKLRANDRCGTWFGPSVSAVVCAPLRLRAAVSSGRVRGRGGFSLSRVAADSESTRRRSSPSASAPGIAQAMGGALRPGDRMRLRGEVAENGTLLVRAANRRHIVEAQFADVGRHTRGRAIISVGSRSGKPAVTLLTRAGTKVRPDEVRHRRLPHKR